MRDAAAIAVLLMLIFAAVVLGWERDADRAEKGEGDDSDATRNPFT
jgi:hypothetical protein